MSKGRDRTKKAKPAPRPHRASGRAPAAKATSKRSAKAPRTKPTAKPAAKPASAKPAAAKAHAAKPAAAKPAPAKAQAAQAAPGNAVRPVRAGASIPLAAIPLKPIPKVEAPAKFRREYKKWLERLISLRRQLVVDGERLGEEGLKAQEQEVSVDHMADFGSDSYEQDTTLALIENKSDALRDVDEAIRRIEAKTYGLCEECEQLLPHGRLEVLPHARYCVKCQSAREGVA